MSDQNESGLVGAEVKSSSPLPTMAVFIAAVLICGVALFAWKTYPQSEVESEIAGVVYVDTGAIISAATQRFLDEKKAGDPTLSGKEFSDKLGNAIEKYSDSGLLVLDKRLIVAAPKGHDITNEVATELGLVLGQ